MVAVPTQTSSLLHLYRVSGQGPVRAPHGRPSSPLTVAPHGRPPMCRGLVINTNTAEVAPNIRSQRFIIFHLLSFVKPMIIIFVVYNIMLRCMAYKL